MALEIEIVPILSDNYVYLAKDAGSGKVLWDEVSGLSLVFRLTPRPLEPLAPGFYTCDAMTAVGWRTARAAATAQRSAS